MTLTLQGLPRAGNKSSLKRIETLQNQARPLSRSIRMDELRAAEILFILWSSNLTHHGKMVPVWSVFGYRTFEAWVVELGYQIEFAKKAVIVWSKFYSEEAIFKWDIRLANTIQKMHQVSRVAQSNKDVNDWLRLSHSVTVEELERLVRRALRDRLGPDIVGARAVLTLVGEEARRYNQFIEYMEANFGASRKAVHVMTAIDEYMERVSSRGRRRAA